MANMSVYAASQARRRRTVAFSRPRACRRQYHASTWSPGPKLTPMLSRVTDGNPEAFGRRVPMGRPVVLPVNGGIAAG